MKIQFLQDYQGYETNDTLCLEGTVTDVPINTALRLIDNDIAVAKTLIEHRGAEAAEEPAPQLVYGIADSGGLVDKDGVPIPQENESDAKPREITGVELNSEPKEPYYTSTVTPVIPLIPTEEPAAFEKRKAKHGAGYSEKTKGSRK